MVLDTVQLPAPNFDWNRRLPRGGLKNKTAIMRLLMLSSDHDFGNFLCQEWILKPYNQLFRACLRPRSTEDEVGLFERLSDMFNVCQYDWMNMVKNVSDRVVQEARIHPLSEDLLDYEIDGVITTIAAQIVRGGLENGYWIRPDSTEDLGDIAVRLVGWIIHIHRSQLSAGKQQRTMGRSKRWVRFLRHNWTRLGYKAYWDRFRIQPTQDTDMQTSPLEQEEPHQVIRPLLTGLSP